MNKKQTLIALLVVFFAMNVFPLLIKNGNQAQSYSTGAPAGYTGSPADVQTCTSCHAGPAATTQTGWITSNVPVSGYVPSTTYTITATATRAGHTRFGFEISPQNIAGTLLGTLLNTSPQTLITGTKYITHSSSGTTGTTGFHTWTFNWTAPAAGTGAVTFYGAFNVTNFSSNTLGDTIYKSTLIIPETAPLTASIFVNNNVSCNGGSNGGATVTPGGGASPYSYSWNTTPIQHTAAATSLSSGTYIVTVTDANSTIKTSSVTISQPSAISASVTSQTNVSCNGGANGSATALASGGTGTLNYSWNTIPVQNSTVAANLTAGIYTVIITDANSCVKTSSVTINQPPAINASINSQINLTCFGSNNGIATAAATGGTGTFSYAWNTSPVQNTATAVNLSAATYTVTITDANSCTKTSSTTITQPQPVSVSIVSQNNLSCSGGNTGSATAAASGGTGSLNYSWNTSPVQNAATAVGLSAATYVVTVTDANNCTSTAGVNIIQPPPVTASVNTHSNVSCNGGNNGSATVSASGGSGNYTYSWNTIPAQNSIVASSLAPGSYLVTVSDVHNCTSTAGVTITQPAIISSSVTSQINVSCNGGSNGSAIVIASGGTGALNFLWNTTPGQNTATVNGLSAASYTVTITDANGCSSTSLVTINEPTPIAIITSSTNASCGNSDGTATAAASGGTGTFSYSWNTIPVQTNATASGLEAGSYVVTITDALGCTQTETANVSNTSAPIVSILSQTDNTCYGGSNGSATISISSGTPPYSISWDTNPTQTTAAINSLSQGTYNATVTDNVGCLTIKSVTISEPPPISILLSQTNVSCNGGNNGSVIANVSGGTGSFSYAWNTSPVQHNANAAGLSASPYTVIVTDNNNCTAASTINITQPPAISASIITFNSVSCNGGNNGSATISASGGTGAFSYAWNTSPIQHNASAVNLPAATYIVTVTDANSCTSTTSISLSQPAAINASINSHINVSCNGGNNGRASVTASGGTGTLSYSWNTSPIQTQPNALGLFAAIYTVTVTDFNNCTKTSSVTITQPAPVAASISSSVNAVCFGGNSGSATVHASGGIAPYSYSWNTSPVQHTAAATSLHAGNFTVTVTDANQCTSTANVVITQPGSITVTTTSINATCGNSDGSASVTAAGGAGSYSYIWNSSPIQTTQTAIGLAAGTYSVTVRDATGCMISSSVNITNVSAPAIIISSQSNVTCHGLNNGSATAAAFGGTPNYTYQWNTTPVQNSAIATSLAPGHYNVKVTDGLGCIAIQPVTITEPPVISINESHINTSCNAGSNGSITITSSGGTGILSYLWNTIPQQISATAFGLSAGAYIVTVTDANNCTSSSSVTITEPQPIVVTISNDTLLCEGDCTVLSASAAGGQGPITYLWILTGDTSSSINICPTASDSYDLTVTDSIGCSNDSSSVNVDVIELPLISFLLNPDTVCSNSGLISLTGGHPNGGIYSGSGVSNGIFDPSITGTGLFYISYTYTDFNNCSNSDSNSIFVDLCNGISAGSNSYEPIIYPNPNNGAFTVTSPNKNYELTITTLLGETVYKSVVNEEVFRVELENEKSKTLILQMKSILGVVTKRLIVLEAN